MSRTGIIGAAGCQQSDGSWVSAGLYELASNQTLSVEVVDVFPPNEMVVTPNPVRTLGEGDTITFTVGKKYDNPEYLEVLRWYFRPDSTATNPNPVSQSLCGSGGSGSTCRLTATVPGTMWAVGKWNYVRSDSVGVQVDVIKCPFPNDTVINNKYVRQRLLREFELSDSTQLERGGTIYRDSLGSYSVVFDLVAPAPTQCRNSARIQRGDSFYTPVAIWHTHPIVDRPFTNCPTSPAGSRALRGPSTIDFNTQRDVAPLSMYIIDERDVYRVGGQAGRRWWQRDVASSSWRACAGWAE